MSNKHVCEFAKIGKRLGWAITGSEMHTELLKYVKSEDMYLSVSVLDSFGKQEILDEIKKEINNCENEEFKFYLDELYKISNRKIRKSYKEIKREVKELPEFPFH